MTNVDIKCFNPIVEKEFIFLQEEYGFLIKETEQYSSYSYLLYEKNDIYVSVGFSFHDHEVGLSFGIDRTDLGREYSFTTVDLLRLNGTDSRAECSTFMAFDHEKLIDCIKRLALLLRKYGEPYLRGNKRAYKQLKKTKDAAVKKYWRDMELAMMREKLETAWRQKDYDQIITLLKPHLPYLEKSEIKKYEYATKHLDR